MKAPGARFVRCLSVPLTPEAGTGRCSALHTPGASPGHQRGRRRGGSTARVNALLNAPVERNRRENSSVSHLWWLFSLAMADEEGENLPLGQTCGVYTAPGGPRCRGSSSRSGPSRRRCNSQHRQMLLIVTYHSLASKANLQQFHQRAPGSQAQELLCAQLSAAALGRSALIP